MRRRVSSGVWHHAFRCLAYAIAATALTSPAALMGETLASGHVMLTTHIPKPPPPAEDGAEYFPSNWVREIFRQAFLMTARDHFGLATRDATLGEPVDRDDPECFHLSVLGWKLNKEDRIEVRLQRGQTTIHEQVLNIELDSAGRYPPVVEAALKMRLSLVPVLTEAGYQPVEPTEVVEEALPEDVAHLLARMNHVSQYAAVRRLHALMRYEGPSEAVLGGLARGYANLSKLTVPVLDLRAKAFAARAMLYAFALSELNPDSGPAHWHRAYAFLMSGFPSLIAGELHKAGQKTTDEPDQPAWVPLIQLSRNHKFQELENLARDEGHPHRELAALLWFSSSRHSIASAFTIQTGKAAREIIPHCQFITAELFTVAGVAMNHANSVECFQSHGELIRTHYNTIPELADDLALQSAAERGLPDVVASLRDFAETDVDEPSVHVLAENTQAWHTQHLFQRARFLKSSLGVEATSFVDAAMPSMDGQRYASLFAVAGLPKLATPAMKIEKTKQVERDEINFCSVGYQLLNDLERDLPTGEGSVQSYINDAWYCAGDDSDSIRKRFYDYSNEDKLRFMNYVRQMTTNSPLVFSYRVLLDWEKVRKKSLTWEIRYPGYPGLQLALARSEKAYGDLDKAIGHYDRYLSVVDDVSGYIGLAEAWYMNGDERWMDILRQGLECEDPALYHSKIGQRAASTLMQEGRFDDALEWARIAARSYSAWGVDSLIDCFTGLGRFEEAEQLAREMSERYDATDWYDWCVATGRGDHDCAWKFTNQLFERAYARDNGLWLIAGAIDAMAKGDDPRALKTLQELVDSTTLRVRPADGQWVEWMAAVLADRLEQSAFRDKMLQNIIDTTPADRSPNGAETLAQVVQAALAAEDFDVEAIIASVAANENDDVRAADSFFVGHLLWTRGAHEEAVELWKVPARATSGWNRLLAWTWLRNAGVDPIHIPNRQFPAPFLKKQRKRPGRTDAAARESDAAAE